jgi:hypothetical protein
LAHIGGTLAIKISQKIPREVNFIMVNCLASKIPKNLSIKFNPVTTGLKRLKSFSNELIRTIIFQKLLLIRQSLGFRKNFNLKFQNLERNQE